MKREDYLELRKRFDHSIEQRNLYYNCMPRYSKGTIKLLLTRKEYDDMINYEISHPEDNEGQQSYGIHWTKRYTIPESK